MQEVRTIGMFFFCHRLEYLCVDVPETFADRIGFVYRMSLII